MEELSEDLVAVLRFGVHRLFCTPREPVLEGDKKGRSRLHGELLQERGDKGGEYPCLCSDLPITYNGVIIPPEDREG